MTDDSTTKRRPHWFLRIVVGAVVTGLVALGVWWVQQRLKTPEPNAPPPPSWKK